MEKILKNNVRYGVAMVLVMILSIGVFILSCSNDVESDYASTILTQKEQELLNKSSVYGEQHNAYMEKIYEKIYLMTNLKGDSKLLFSQENVVDVVKSSTINVIGYGTYSLNTEVKEIIDESFFVGKNVRTKNTNKDNIINSIINNSGMSSNFNKLYKDLIAISNNNNLSIERQKKEIEKLEKTAINTLNEKELDCFLAGSSVSKASFEYWHTNMDKWVDLFGVNKKVRLKNDSEFWLPGGGLYNGMTGADVGGAVSGAITGAFAGAAAGGIGAGPGAFLGGIVAGVGASTGQVVNNIGNYLGWW